MENLLAICVSLINTISANLTTSGSILAMFLASEIMLSFSVIN